MNQELPYIPERTQPPRESGLNMMKDKGLGLRGDTFFTLLPYTFHDKKL
jgi:hypothetical protein